MAQNADKPNEHQYELIENILYRTKRDLDVYQSERCRLDLYYPKDKPGFATVVWFHGGGLKAGNRSIPKRLKRQGFAVIAVNYRLHPRVQSPAYIEDAAASVAWTFNQIANYGGDPKKIFVAGKSAGGYLTSMVGYDKRWLAAFNIDADEICGLIPLSGHTITHFTVRAERGIDGKKPFIDDMAPLFHIRNEAPPTLLITGDRELEMLGRYEENAYMWRMLKVVEHPDVTLHELEGFNHGDMTEPALPLLVKFVKQHSRPDSKQD